MSIPGTPESIEPEVDFKTEITSRFPDDILGFIELDNHDKERAMDYNFFVRRKLVLIDIIFFILLAAALILLNLFGVIDVSLPILYGAFGVLLLIFLFFIFVKMFSAVGGSITRFVVIREDGIITGVKGEKKEHSLEWQDFVHIGKTKNYYLLYPDNTQYLVIPKRCFSKEDNLKIKEWIK